MENLRKDVRAYLQAVDIEKLRDGLRAFLRELSDREGQKRLAKRIGISHSWLNKFLCGQFPNLRAHRLRRLAQFVDRELEKNNRPKKADTSKVEREQLCGSAQTIR